MRDNSSRPGMIWPVLGQLKAIAGSTVPAPQIYRALFFFFYIIIIIFPFQRALFSPSLFSFTPLNH